MTAAINETCIGEGDFSGAEMGIFLLLDGILPPSTGFPSNGRSGGRGRAHATSKLKGGDTFLVRWGIQGGDNSAGQFALRDLISFSFFK